jgi:hypothetical protein
VRRAVVYGLPTGDLMKVGCPTIARNVEVGMITKEARDIIERWLKNEDNIIGVFECQALDSQYIGQRFAIPFSKSQEDVMVVGKTRAPDGTQFGPGWKFILVAKSFVTDDIVKALENKE